MLLYCCLWLGGVVAVWMMMDGSQCVSVLCCVGRMHPSPLLTKGPKIPKIFYLRTAFYFTIARTKFRESVVDRNRSSK